MNWSFSSLMVYEGCPLRFKLDKIDRLPKPELPPDNPMERGNRVHNRHELYVRGDSDVYDSEARRSEDFRPLVDHLRTLYAAGMVTLEQDWLFDEHWDCTEKNVPESPIWLWAKLDVCVLDEGNGRVVVIDYKTGKSQYKAIEHVQQMQLYAAIAALKYPWAEVIEVELWYLDEGHIKASSYTREQALTFIGRFDVRAARIFADKLYRPNANAHTCRYCPFSPRGTGACAVGV